MSEAADPAREFLNAFSDIEMYVRRKLKAGRGERFTSLVDRLAATDRSVQEHEVSLKAFAALRNAIVHDKYREGLPIATPHPDVVHAICRVRDQLEQPPRVGEAVQGRGAVQVVAPDVGVWHALRSMAEHDHSQVLVYGDGGYAGLLTTNAIARWVAAQVDEAGEILAEEAPVVEVLRAAESFEVARFVSRQTTVNEVIDLLSGAAGRPAPVAVVVTRNGKQAETPLGILVVHDLPDLLERVTVNF